MRTHRPWQPHMSTSPLFNPFTPSIHTTLDHYDMVEEEETEELAASEELAMDQASDPPPLMRRD
jgi:hypothetical protein